MESINFFENLKSVYIIAEVGVNHNGDINLAKILIDKAKECGADAVKFQSYKAKKLANKETPKVKYQKLNTLKIDETHLEMLQKYELSEDDHIHLKNYCDKKNIDFLSTPYDVESAKLLTSLQVKMFKVASADLVDYQLHKYLASTFKPIIISTGMSTLREIEQTLKIYDVQKSSIVLLHCVSNYPCSLKSLNLNSIEFLKNYFSLPVGYSDHSSDSMAAPISVALSSKVFEKHLTLDKKMEGPDHMASSNPEEFLNLVNNIRKTEIILGNYSKSVKEEELEMRKISRKSIYLARNVKINQKIKENDFNLKRPGIGISPLEIPNIIGKSYSREINEGELLKKEDLKS